MTVREDIDAGTKALQAADKKDEELGRVVEDDLAREEHGSGEEDLVDCRAKSEGSFLGQDGVN